MNSAGNPLGNRRAAARWRWLAGVACGAVLVVPSAAVAVGAMTPAAAASVSPVIAVAARQAVTPADQFLRGVLPGGPVLPGSGLVHPVGWDQAAAG